VADLQIRAIPIWFLSITLTLGMMQKTTLFHLHLSYIMDRKGREKKDKGLLFIGT